MKYTLQFQKTDTLGANLNSGETSGTLTNGNFGTPSGKQLLVIDYDVAAKREVILATIAGTALTSIVRNIDGVGDVDHSIGANVIMAFVPDHYEILANAVDSGWVEESVNETWVYASASTFTIAGIDVTAKYQKGTKLRFKQGGGYKYAVVASSSFSTDTIVTIIVNTDYTIANAAITDNAYSYVENPQGFPKSFAYAVTWTSNGTAPAIGNGTLVGRWQPKSGNSLRVDILQIMGSTTTYGTGAYSWSIPVTSANKSVRYIGSGRLLDSGTAHFSSIAEIVPNSNFIVGYGYNVGNQHSQTIPFTWAANDTLSLSCEYEY